MKKATIVNLRRIYCSGCGYKNKLVPVSFLGQERYDGQTGKPLFHYICQNSNCSVGKLEYKQQTIDMCKDHKKGDGFFSIITDLFDGGILGKDKCRHCKQPSFASEGMGWS